MKKKTYLHFSNIFLAMFVMLTSCVSSQSFWPVKGTGMLKDKNFQVSGFHGIDVSSGFDVTLVQGNTEGVTLSAQENLYQYIQVKVDNGVLKIYTDQNVMTTKSMKARISFKSIDNLNVSGGGDVFSETEINVPLLTIGLSGGGDLNMTLNANELKCHISGGGDAKIGGSIKDYDMNITGGGDIQSDVNAKNISCSISGGGDINFKSTEKSAEANMSVTGGGDAIINVNTEKMKCSISGGGDASLSGTASNLDINLNGGGDLNAADLLTENTVFHASGGSDIHINASRELTGYISGGGNVYYSGNPGNVQIDAKGGSEVHKQ